MARHKKGEPISGWLILDKPAGITSAQAVAKAKRALNARKVGHGGTLDPLATGLLPLAFGEATKVVSYALYGDKSYRFSIRWGETRDTDDAEGVVVATSDRRPSAAEIIAVLPGLTGHIQQKPPSFSAIKVDGERAYDLARDGAPPDLPPREVIVEQFDLVDADEETATFEVSCGKGTYIRSLARDMAAMLGTCGYVDSLRRTRVGPFTEKDAISLDKLEEFGHSPAPCGLLLPIETPLDDIPAVAVMESEAQRLRNGQSVFVPHQIEGEVLIMISGTPVGIGLLEGGTLRPKRLFVFDQRRTRCRLRLNVNRN
ncbi:MAG: tRNA pseudouridine(55) synthase TruB [Proteobacteria bacterium]|nr:tRNA pseudouridine(55) synthase TruB [Pseudomonadota bacterium]